MSQKVRLRAAGQTGDIHVSRGEKRIPPLLTFSPKSQSTHHKFLAILPNFIQYFTEPIPLHHCPIMLSQSHLRGRASSAPASTRATLTAKNLRAAGSQYAPRGTSHGPSRMYRGRGRRRAARVSRDTDTDLTLRLASDQESADDEGPREANWRADPVPGFNPAANMNTQRETTGAGSLFRQGSTYNMNFAQLAAYRRTCFPFTDQPAIMAQRQQQHDQLTGAVGSIMGVDAAVASGWATDIQSQFQGPVQQCTLPQRGTQPGIPHSIFQAPVSLVVMIKATPEVLRFFQESIYGQSQNTAHDRSPSRVPSDETIGPGNPEFEAEVQMKPPRPGFRNKLRALGDKLTRSPAAPPTAISQDAPRDSYSELREQLSQILPAQGNAQRGAPSYAPGGQFTLADLAAAQSAAGPSNRTNLMPLNGGTAPTGVHQWLENQGQSCAREYYGPQETMGGSTHGPQPSFVF
jgi:hypothetical protein